jgi:hypothetical protein
MSATASTAPSRWLRWLGRVLPVAIAIVVLSVLVSGIAQIEAAWKRGADPATALNLPPSTASDVHVDLQWLPDAADTGRRMDATTRRDVALAYARAWKELNHAYVAANSLGLQNFWAKPALTVAEQAVDDAARQGWWIRQTDLAHRLKLHFYSDDGSIAAFTDAGANIVQLVGDEAALNPIATETVASYDVVMVLHEGGWKMHEWRRTGSVDLETEPQTHAQPLPGMVGRDGKNLILNGQPYRIAGINYYPQATPWDRFWPQYDPAIIDRDFAHIADLRLNTVRIFVPFEQFGGPKLDPVMRDRLVDLLERAAAHDLKVIVTLFDFRTDYNPLLWPESDRQLQALLTAFATNRTILAWDVKNEPDRDYGAAGRTIVESWLRHTLRQARKHDPHHLLTIGWSTPGAAEALTDHVDIVSLHFYDYADRYAAQYAMLRTAAPDHPIVLGEFGLPTWNSFLMPNGHTEPEQAQYYADLLAAARRTDSAGYLAWTLHDFDHAPPGVAGGWPWQTGPQRHLGVLRADGTPKPAAALLPPDASLQVRRVPGWARVFKPFSLMCVVVGVGIVFWVGRMVGRRRG